MYAIRSYYERYASTLVRIWEQARHEVVMPPAFEAILRVGAQAGLWNRMLYRWLPWMREAARITSYNVCYTKLLRGRAPLPTYERCRGGPHFEIGRSDVPPGRRRG